MSELKNNYGFFDWDEGWGDPYFLITNPQTPMPWVNVISNGDYGLVVSQAGGGYSWRTHAGLNRITRWDQDLIRDEWGKFFYIRDMDTGEFWSPTLQPCGSAPDENTFIMHWMGLSQFFALHSDIFSELSVSVPLDAPCEIWSLQLDNRGKTPRRLQIFSYFEWLLGAAPDWHREFHKTFIKTEYDTEHGAILATKVMWDVPDGRKSHWNRDWEHVAFHSASIMPSGFDTDKRDFIGRHGTIGSPKAVREGKSTGRAGRWGDAIGSLCVEITLQPNEHKTVDFTIGAADTRESAIEIIHRFKDANTISQADENTAQFWRELTRRLQVKTPDAPLNMMGNSWLAYQAISGRLFGRSAYFQTGGAFGFRDQLQDSLTWLLLGLPEKTLNQIKLHAAHQYQDGVVLHWWQPMVETGHRSEYSDDLLWLPFVLMRYLWETGDYGALDLDVPFYDGGSASLREHCMRAFNVALSRRSARGLPLILKADWNDGLNAVGIEGRGESVWMAHFLYGLLRDWAALTSTDDDTRAHFTLEAEAIRAAVNTHGWDGAWYWRASTDSGRLLGSHTCSEGKIFLNANTWAAISGTADESRARQVMQSVRQHLYQDYGALLFAPAYSIPDPEIGYLSRYAPGIRENGGVYSHAACWAVLAERKVNGVNAAYQLWRSFCPPVRAAADPDRWSGEPYVMPGNISGPDAEISGQAGWTWYTGSSGWMLRALIEGVLGIEARLEGLRVNAALPDGWNEYTVKRIYRGAAYQIHIQRGDTAGITVDGSAWAGDVLPTAPTGSTVRVEVTI